MKLNQIYNENCLVGLKKLPDNCIDCCVTSPPYFGLRDYGTDEQIGMEETPEKFVDNLVAVFSEVHRVLKKDGTLWVNLGDSYSGSMSTKDSVINPNSLSAKAGHTKGGKSKPIGIIRGLKRKDLIGIPWRVAFALQADGWYLRQDIIWSKPNPMPESVKDRCTKSHEYIFMLTKSAKYYYDNEAIAEPAIYSGVSGQDKSGYKDAKKFNGKHSDKQRGHSRRHAGFNDRWDKMTKEEQCSGMRNKRSVWNVATKPYKEAHFATFPEKLIVDCIKAGCPENGIVLDPFMGAGTTALVAQKLNRSYIGYELNKEYIQISEKRLFTEIGLFK